MSTMVQILDYVHFSPKSTVSGMNTDSICVQCVLPCSSHNSPRHGLEQRFLDGKEASVWSTKPCSEDTWNIREREREGEEREREREREREKERGGRGTYPWGRPVSGSCRGRCLPPGPREASAEPAPAGPLPWLPEPAPPHPHTITTTHT